jgi:hypothetical protein
MAMQHVHTIGRDVIGVHRIGTSRK